MGSRIRAKGYKLREATLPLAQGRSNPSTLKIVVGTNVRQVCGVLSQTPLWTCHPEGSCRRVKKRIHDPKKRTKRHSYLYYIVKDDYEFKGEVMSQIEFYTPQSDFLT